MGRHAHTSLLEVLPNSFYSRRQSCNGWMNFFCKQFLKSFQHGSGMVRGTGVLWYPSSHPATVWLLTLSRKEEARHLDLTHQLLLRPHRPCQDLRFPDTLLTSWKLLHPAEDATPWVPGRSGKVNKTKSQKQAPFLWLPPFFFQEWLMDTAGTWRGHFPETLRPPWAVWADEPLTIKGKGWGWVYGGLCQCEWWALLSPSELLGAQEDLSPRPECLRWDLNLTHGDLRPSSASWESGKMKKPGHVFCLFWIKTEYKQLAFPLL